MLTDATVVVVVVVVSPQRWRILESVQPTP
jgi:hypothetical protein